MQEPITNGAVTPQITLTDTHGFRQAAINNDWSLVPVEYRGKRPISKGWQHGTSQAVLSACTSPQNTGILLDGFRVLDFDIDDHKTAAKAYKAAKEIAPDGALIRGRRHSTRFAMVYRAAEGEPPKQSFKGPDGGVDILGKGCQLVAHGVHPEGELYAWVGGRSPATVPVNDVPAISEADIARIIKAVRPFIGAAGTIRAVSVDILSQPGLMTVGAINDNELGAGIDTDGWFSRCLPNGMHSALKAMVGAIDNQTHDPRDQWRQVGWTCRHAADLGCPGAYEVFLEWSQRGAGWPKSSEGDVLTLWNSYTPGKTTIGTLIYLAEQAGVDLGPWRDAANTSAALTCAANTPPMVAARTMTGLLSTTPKKRQLLCGTILTRGTITMLSAAGGKGKSALAVTLAMSLASGRPLLNMHVFGGPLRVVYLNGEDPFNEMHRRFYAAASHYGLTEAEVPGLTVMGADDTHFSLLKQDRNGPSLDLAGWDALKRMLAQLKPDVLILDPLVSFTGGATLNDNAAAALLIGGLVRLAAKFNCAIMIAHHVRKGAGTDQEAAMGAASLINLSRTGLNIEGLSEKEAPAIGVPPSEAASIFKLVGTKQNLSQADGTPRYFKLHSVELPNAEPPVYPWGDNVGVVVPFTPNLGGSPYPAQVIQAVQTAITTAPIPLSPSPNSPQFAVPVIASAMTTAQGQIATSADAKALLGWLIQTGQVTQGQMSVPRPGRGTYTRAGLTWPIKVPATP